VHRFQAFLLIIALFISACSRADATSGTTIPHPDKRGASVEYYVEQPAGRGPWKTVIFLHGHQGPMGRIGGKAYVNWGVLRRFADNGYLAVSVSLPGYGNSDGPEDFAGQFTQNAVNAVMTKLIADRQASPDKILIQGVSLGAVTAALLASQHSNVRGLVLISGLYDFPAYFTRPNSPAALQIREVLTQQTGGSLEALRSRSALLVAPQIRAATLIINGGNDDRTDPVQAKLFAATINANGGRATAHIYPQFGHEIPVQARDAEISRFINATLGQ
jgi:dipeptidyl aminopeptidase/acylaminoacyl peptidase